MNPLTFFPWLIQEGAFWVFALATVFGAIAVVVSQNVARMAFWLIVSLGSTAGLFFSLNADFVGATQLLIYVGGTLVLVIFGVMLTATGPFVNLASRPGDWALSLIGGFLLFGVLCYCLSTGNVVLQTESRTSQLAPPTANKIGMALMGLADAGGEAPESEKSILMPSGAPPRRTGNYVLPFIIISVHLVVVLIGAAYLARPKRRAVAGAQ